MYCSRCGAERPQGAAYCPNCGAAFTDLVVAAEPQGGGITETFGRAFATLFSRAALRPLALTVAAAAAGGLLLAASAAATVLAAFGTLSPHRLVDTSCFVQRSPNSFDAAGGQRWDVIPGCDAFPLSPNVAALAGLGALTAVVSMAVGFCCYLLLNRLSDQAMQSYRDRALPAPRRMLVAAGRALGWALVATAAVFGLLIAVVLIALVLAALLPGALVALLMVGAGIYLAIRYAAVWYVRFQLAFVRMVIDDRPLPDCWNDMRMITVGRAWAYIGLTTAAGFGFGIASNVATAVAGAGAALAVIGVAVYLVVLATQYLWTALFTTAVMRQLSTAEPAAEADAVRPA